MQLSVKLDIMKNTFAMNWDVAGEYEEYLSGSDMPLDHADGA